MPASFQYSAFLSCSSKNKDWASRLHAGLEARLGGNPVFWDSERLEEGQPWNTQLMAALQGSEQVVVFCSENASKFAV